MNLKKKKRTLVMKKQINLSLIYDWLWILLLFFFYLGTSQLKEFKKKKHKVFTEITLALEEVALTFSDESSWLLAPEKIIH